MCIDIQKACGPLVRHEARFLARHESGTVQINAGSGSAQPRERVGLDSHPSPLGWRARPDGSWA
jgi:hypothetical protein